MDEQNPDDVVENVEEIQEQQHMEYSRREIDEGLVEHREPLQVEVNPQQQEIVNEPFTDVYMHLLVLYRRWLSRRLDGLTPERIERFEHFDADESLVGERCLVCMSDLEVGTKMVRLDCHVDHYLCKVCAHGWFKDHKTFPTCRHVFN